MINEAVSIANSYFNLLFIKGLAVCKIGTISLIWVVEQPNIVAKKIQIFQLLIFSNTLTLRTGVVKCTVCTPVLRNWDVYRGSEFFPSRIRIEVF
jgi:hypothetical protein